MHQTDEKSSVLSLSNPQARFLLGDTLLLYTLDETSLAVGFSCMPAERWPQRVQKRAILDGPELQHLPRAWLPMAARRVDSLVQCAVRGRGGPDAFAAGLTLRNNPAVAALRFQSQQAIEEDDQLSVITTLVDAHGQFRVQHTVAGCAGESFFRTFTRFENTSAHPLTLDMLASFSLGSITPFDAADAPRRLRLHRLRSAWSAEARLDSRWLEELNLERSWSGHGVRCIRFGQVGSMPVRGWAPLVAVEDASAKVLWGAQLGIASSWQMELYRRHDDVALSGGLADREFGHWSKTLLPGENFTSPAAVLATAVGDIDDLCHRLTSAQRAAADRQPAVERGLPIIFNEWCSSWGNPTHENVLAAARALDPAHVRYVVIDDGWVQRPTVASQYNGDWDVNRAAFPGGLKQTCDALRQMGFIPGIWFEFEVCTEGTRAFESVQHHLHLDRQPLQIGRRRFWDFRDRFTFDYLSVKVIQLLRDCGFGYLKVDYNDSLGIGCDGDDSPGEGLRQHILGVQRFFDQLRQAMPELVIENCASGGHRLEPSMMARAAMGSFSDAHETVEIPIIAANVHRMILPRQSQIWAVLHREDSLQRLRYSLSATFLGRMCLSGELAQLSGEQLQEVGEAQRFYQAAAPLLSEGKSRLQQQVDRSYRHPRGWQAVVRTAGDEQSLLVVLHTFDQPPVQAMRVQLPAGRWNLAERYNLPPEQVKLEASVARVSPMPAFAGAAMILRQVK